MKTTGELLKHLREVKGVSMDQMTEDLKRYGVSPSKSMVSRWENNKSDPSMEYARILADYFNVSLDCLIGLKEYERNGPKDAREILDDLFRIHKYFTEDELNKIYDYVQFIVSQRR